MTNRVQPTDAQLLAAIARYQMTHGYGPSFRDLMAASGLGSTSVCQYRLKRLERDGLIRRDDHVPRSIRLTGAGEAATA